MRMANGEPAGGFNELMEVELTEARKNWFQEHTTPRARAHRVGSFEQIR